MLRITVHEKQRALTFQLEGKLAGPMVRVLQECWHNVRARQVQTVMQVDLTGLTSIDAGGKACLAALYRQGAQFIAADCLTHAVVVEITQECAADCDGAPPKRRFHSANSEEMQ